MDEIDYGDPDSSGEPTTETFVEMANITGGSLAGLFPTSRPYKSRSGRTTSISAKLAHLKESLFGHGEPDGGSDSPTS